MHSTKAAMGLKNQLTNTLATPQTTVNGIKPIKPWRCTSNGSIEVSSQ